MQRQSSWCVCPRLGVLVVALLGLLSATPSWATTWAHSAGSFRWVSDSRFVVVTPIQGEPSNTPGGRMQLELYAASDGLDRSTTPSQQFTFLSRPGDLVESVLLQNVDAFRSRGRLLLRTSIGAIGSTPHLIDGGQAGGTLAICRFDEDRGHEPAITFVQFQPGQTEPVRQTRVAAASV